MNWKVLAGVVLVLYVSVTSTKETRSTATNIQHGLSLAKEFGNLVESKKFTNVIGDIAKAVNPYLGIVGPFISLITGLAGHSESAELKAIKHLYTEVDTRFDKVDSQFAQVKSLIDWKTIEIQYSDVENKINAVNREFEHIYTFSHTAVKSSASAFVSSYKSHYALSGTILYDGIMHKGRLFGNSILTAVTKFTKNHRAKCQVFFMGLLKLLIKAAKLELAYHQMTNKAALHDYENEWKAHMTHVGEEMRKIDKSILDHYQTQVGEDIDDLAVDNPKSKMNNEAFNNHLYAHLVEKFPWRDWFVVTYNDITGGNKHWVKQCDGHTKFRNHGRNIVVASVAKGKAHINLAQARSIVDKVNNCNPKTTNGYTIYRRTDSDKAYNTFPTSVRSHCSPYAGYGVIEFTKHNGNDVHFKADPHRIYVKKQENCNFVYVFG